jgi:hypothetical protein
MNDDLLILYYYDDGLSERERRRVAAALAADPGLADRYATLCADLGRLTDAEPVALPADVRRRLHASIDRLARPAVAAPEAPARRFAFLPFAWGAAIAAALTIGIAIGVFVRDPGPPAATIAGDPFLRGMQVYLADTRRDIAALPSGTPADRQRLILQIVDQNRLFERAAERNDARDLARVLRAFEPVLLRLATEDLAPEDAEALRAQLAFELGVMLTKLARDPSKESTST